MNWPWDKIQNRTGNFPSQELAEQQWRWVLNISIKMWMYLFNVFKNFVWINFINYWAKFLSSYYWDVLTSHYLQKLATKLFFCVIMYFITWNFTIIFNFRLSLFFCNKKCALRHFDFALLKIWNKEMLKSIINKIFYTIVWNSQNFPWLSIFLKNIRKFILTRQIR